MAHIALVGATGNLGRPILEEALQRGHQVTAVTRDQGKLGSRAGLTVAKADTHEPAGLAAVLAGHDVIVVSVKWTENDVGEVIDAVRRSGVRRALFVVGAGSLLREDGRTHFAHMEEKGTPPPTSKPAMQALDVIREVTDFDWTAISPSASIPAGERTGKFRLDTDRLIVAPDGVSTISRQDFAIAIVDEIETPRHVRQRFTAGY